MSESQYAPLATSATKPRWLVATQRFLFAQTSLEAQLYPPVSPDVKFRPYEGNDFDACLTIYAKNEPGRFPENHRSKFERYLKQEKKNLIVAEWKSKIVGYGGITLLAPNVAILCYGIIDPAFQRQRIGSALTLLRIAQLESCSSGAFAFIFAVDASMPVYRRFGFIEKSKWKADDGTEHPMGFLHVDVTSLDRVKSVLNRRRLRIHGNLVLHKSEELSCEIKEVGGHYSFQIEPRSNKTGSSFTPTPL